MKNTRLDVWTKTKAEKNQQLKPCNVQTDKDQTWGVVSTDHMVWTVEILPWEPPVLSPIT